MMSPGHVLDKGRIMVIGCGNTISARWRPMRWIERLTNDLEACVELRFAVSCPVRPPSDPWQRTNCGPSINAPWIAALTIQRIGICYKQRHGRRCSINLRCQCLAQGTFWSILIIESLVCTRGNWQGDSGRGLSLKEEWTPRLTRQFIMGWFQSETTTRWFWCPPIVVSNLEDLPLMLVDRSMKSVCEFVNLVSSSLEL